MAINSKQETFQTSDTPLAAYLYVSGKKLIKADTSKFPALFTFDKNSDDSFDELVSLWESGLAIGNVRTFYLTYKNFVKKIKDNSDG